MEGMQDLFGNKTATTAFQQRYQKIVAEVLQDKEVQQFLQEFSKKLFSPFGIYSTTGCSSPRSRNVY